MPVIPIPYDDLFAFDYQLNYISRTGWIDVGPHHYNVFYNYTIQERQQIFQVCEKYLPWQYSQEQEHWERTIYMYQFIIKSPPPFPYSQYTLNSEIHMATLSDEQCTYVRHRLHDVALDLLEAESPHLTKAQIKAALQAIEDWYESERATVKAAIDTAVGQTINNSLAKKLGKFWMQIKWELE